MKTSSSSQTHLEAEITGRRDLAPDLWILRVQTEQPFDFLPGQFATLGVAVDGKLVERPYSIVSSPRESELEFFLERVPAGELSSRLYPLKPGDRISIRKAAKGVFGLDEKSGRRKHLMVATVTGVAPFVSIVRTLRHDERRSSASAGHALFLLEGASRSWELGYDEELTRVEKKVSWLRYVPTVSRPWEDTAWRGERGRVHEWISKSLELFRCKPSDTTAYLCGHPGMIEAGRDILSASGFAKEAIQEERFWVAPKEE